MSSLMFLKFLGFFIFGTYIFMVLFLSAIQQFQIMTSWDWNEALFLLHKVAKGAEYQIRSRMGWQVMTTMHGWILTQRFTAINDEMRMKCKFSFNPCTLKVCNLDLFWQMYSY